MPAKRSCTDTDEQKATWRDHPEKYRRYRKLIENELNTRFKFVLRNSKESDEANEVRTAEVPQVVFPCFGSFGGRIS